MSKINDRVVDAFIYPRPFSDKPTEVIINRGLSALYLANNLILKAIRVSNNLYLCVLIDTLLIIGTVYHRRVFCSRINAIFQQYSKTNRWLYIPKLYEQNNRLLIP